MPSPASILPPPLLRIHKHHHLHRAVCVQSQIVPKRSITKLSAPIPRCKAQRQGLHRSLYPAVRTRTLSTIPTTSTAPTLLRFKRATFLSSTSSSSLNNRQQSRPLTNLAETKGKSHGDLLVEELQDLYEIAKDEFEIATESTDGATIYAASDRETAKEALEQLVWVYSLYSGTPVGQLLAELEGRKQEDLPEMEYSFDPETIKPEVKEEVKKRVGQRIRELVSAVEALEERAMNSD